MPTHLHLKLNTIWGWSWRQITCMRVLPNAILHWLSNFNSIAWLLRLLQDAFFNKDHISEDDTFLGMWIIVSNPSRLLESRWRSSSMISGPTCFFRLPPLKHKLGSRTPSGSQAPLSFYFKPSLKVLLWVFYGETYSQENKHKLEHHTKKIWTVMPATFSVNIWFILSTTPFCWGVIFPVNGD